MDSVAINKPTGDSDRELVEKFRAGDEFAFDVLMGRHQQRALNVAYHLLRNYEDAVEVAQDAFVKVHGNIKSFRGECEFTTWLHQIVVNLARNRYRWWNRRAREKSVSLDAPVRDGHDELERQIASPTDGPDMLADRAEFAQRIEAKMAALPVKLREALVLRNVENLSYEEVAAVLGCSVGTVKSRIARAREAMRQAMAGEL